MPIVGFQNEHRFLSNFAPAPVTINGRTYSTAEHAYQAAKTKIAKEQEAIVRTDNPAHAKQLGRRVTLRPDWDTIKYGVMEDIVRAKFVQNDNLAVRLKHTWPEGLIHDNEHGDMLWGTVNQIGRNHLGIILACIRRELLKPKRLPHVQIPFRRL